MLYYKSNKNSTKKGEIIISRVTKYLIGERRINSKGEEYEIIGIEKGSKRKIRFIKTGYETVAESKELNNGTIKDWLSPNVCGKGIVGIEIEKPQSHYLYDRWRDMIRRCYDEDSSNYCTYGAVGSSVSEEWLYFPNFVKDIENMPNHEKLKIKYPNPVDRWEIDKDPKIKGNKIYSKDTVSIIPHSENVKERNERYEYNKKNNLKR